MNYSFILLAILLLIISACEQQQSEGTPGVATSTFLGGNAGIIPEFVPGTPPPEVYDAGSFPFDVVVRLVNQGEFSVPAPRARVTLAGILPEEFGVSPGSLILTPREDILGRQQDAEGNILEPTPVYVEFNRLNHRTPIVGSVLNFPLQASVCYLYGTIASSTLCSRENILEPLANGICEVNQDKKVSNSGAPVQVSSLRESARALDKIGFTFKVVHVGQGEIYSEGSSCNKLERRYEDRVRVRVSSGIPGLTCSGLESGREGELSLYGGEKTITCTQELPRPADFEFPVTIQLLYDYEERVTSQITVKRSETRVGLPAR